MNLDSVLKDLQKVELEKPNSVLSMYLNTDPSDPDQQGGEWKIQLKNGLNSFENYIKQSGNEEEYKNFQYVRGKVEQFVKEHQLNFKKSVVLFASPDDSIWFAETFQMNVKTEFFWQESPITDQLYQLKSRFPKLGVVLLQQARSRVIDAEFGDVNDTIDLIVDGETEAWIKTDLMKNTVDEETDNFANTQVKQNPNRAYKSLAPMVDKLAKDKGWERIIIAGEKDEAELLQRFMNKPVDKILNQNILEMKPSKVIEEVVA